MNDPQMQAAMQAIQTDPTALRQLQTEINTIQTQQGIKAGISAIQKLCWSKCVESIQSQRLTGGEELACFNVPITHSRFKLKCRRTSLKLWKKNKEDKASTVHRSTPILFQC